MSLVSWEPETQVMSLLLDTRIIPHFGARIHLHLFGMGPRAAQENAGRRELAGRCREVRGIAPMSSSIYRYFQNSGDIDLFSLAAKSLYPIDIIMNIYFSDLARNTTSAVCNQNASGFITTPAHHGGYLSDHFVAILQNPTLGILLAVMLPLLAKRTDPSAKPPYILALTCRTGAS